MRTARQSFGRNAALVLSSLVAALLLLECGIRLYSAFWFPRMMQTDTALGWKHTPNTRKTFVNELGERIEVRQNEYGHRGRAYPLSKSPGKYRILVLGDSFTEAIQVGEDDLFTALLERSNSHLEVLNAGVGGYGTVQEYLYLEAAGLEHNPDLVLLMLYENDLTDNCLSASPGLGPRPYAIFTAGSVQLVPRPDSGDFLKYALPVPFAGMLNQHSYLFAFLNGVYQKQRAPHMRKMERADQTRVKECGREVILGMIGKMAQLLTARGIRLGVVLIPSYENVRKGSAPPLQPIIDDCEREGIAYLSLFDRFKREAGRTQLYFAHDIHWTRDGHRVAAEEISNFLNAVMHEGTRGS